MSSGMFDTEEARENFTAELLALINKYEPHLIQGEITDEMIEDGLDVNAPYMVDVWALTVGMVSTTGWTRQYHFVPLAPLWKTRGMIEMLHDWVMDT